MHTPDGLVIPRVVFDKIASGRPAPDAARFLVDSMRGVDLLLVRAVAELAGPGPARTGLRLLERLHAARPEQVEAVLRHPSVGAWSRQAAAALRRGDPARPELMLPLAAAAAIRSEQDLEVAVRCPDGVLALPSVGRAALAPGTYRVVVRRGRAELCGPGVRMRVPADPDEAVAGWHGLRVLGPDADGTSWPGLVIDDVDPYRFPVLAADRLTPAAAEHWRGLFEQAWRLLCRGHRRLALELRTVITVLTPLDEAAAGRRSGTSRTTFGAVGISLPPDPLSLAEALAHEVQHAKLAALLDLVDLVDPVRAEPGSRYPVPWRTDRRPISGLLHGAYAHLGVAAFWRRQWRAEGDAAALAEFTRWRDATSGTVRVLQDSGALTPLGHRFTRGMRHTLDALAAADTPAQSGIGSTS